MYRAKVINQNFALKFSKKNMAILRFHGTYIMLFLPVDVYMSSAVLCLLRMRTNMNPFFVRFGIKGNRGF